MQSMYVRILNKLLHKATPSDSEMLYFLQEYNPSPRYDIADDYDENDESYYGEMLRNKERI